MGRRLGPKKRWRVGRLLENANECGASKNVGFVFMRRQGFTLIEVLIAMAVIGVGLIALVTLFPVGLRSSRLAGDFTAASFIAQQALDNIRASAQVYDPGDLVDTDGDGDLFDDADGDGLGYYELPVSIAAAVSQSARAVAMVEDNHDCAGDILGVQFHRWSAGNRHSRHSL